MINSNELETHEEDSLNPNEEYILVSDLEGFIVLTEEEMRDILRETAEKASSGAIEIAYQEDLRPQIVDLKTEINGLNRSISWWKTGCIISTSLVAIAGCVIALMAGGNHGN